MTMTIDKSTLEATWVYGIYYLSMIGIGMSFGYTILACINGITGRTSVWEMIATCMVYGTFFVIFVLVNRVYAVYRIRRHSNTSGNREQ